MAVVTMNQRTTTFYGTGSMGATDEFLAAIPQYTSPQFVQTTPSEPYYLNNSYQFSAISVTTITDPTNDTNIVGLFSGIMNDFPDVQILTRMSSISYGF